MKFLDQVKIILKLEMVEMVHQALEEKKFINLEDLMVEMVEMVVL